MTNPAEIDALIARLHESCIGHPNAKVPWPHRLLHDAVEALREQLAVDLDQMIHMKKMIEALREQVKTTRLEVEQCHAKSTCCCGDYIKDHSIYDGHTPVAMYDYALDGAESRAKAAEAHAAELAGEIEIAKKFLTEPADLYPTVADAISTLGLALASTPTQALERARARDEVVGTLRELLAMFALGPLGAAATYGPDFDLQAAEAVAAQNAVESLANLDALNPAEQEDGP